jgi:hypothetical protein
MKKIHLGDLATITYQILETGDVRVNSILIGGTELLNSAVRVSSPVSPPPASSPLGDVMPLGTVTSTPNRLPEPTVIVSGTSMSGSAVTVPTTGGSNYQEPPDEFINANQTSVVPTSPTGTRPHEPTALPGAPSSTPDLGAVGHLGEAPASSVQDLSLRPGQWEQAGQQVPVPVTGQVAQQPVGVSAEIQQMAQQASQTALDPVQHAALQAGFKIPVRKTAQTVATTGHVVQHVGHQNVIDISQMDPGIKKAILDAWDRTARLDHQTMLAKLAAAYDGQLPAHVSQLNAEQLKVFAFNTIVMLNLQS